MPVDRFIRLKVGTGLAGTDLGDGVLRLDATGAQPADAYAWMPLTTVTGGVPELVWDATDDLIPTLDANLGGDAMTTRFADHLLDGTHASRPAATAVPAGTLYSCTDHSLVYQSDGATWATWATLGGTAPARIIELKIFDDATTVTTGDGKAHLRHPLPAERAQPHRRRRFRDDGQLERPARPSRSATSPKPPTCSQPKSRLTPQSSRRTRPPPRLSSTPETMTSQPAT